MTLMSPAPTGVKEHRLEVLKNDLQRTFGQCGRRFLTPNPTHGSRTFVIAAEEADIPRDMCSRGGPVQRSALHEQIDERELRELLHDLRAGKYHIHPADRSIDGSWISYTIEYFPGDERS